MRRLSLWMRAHPIFGDGVATALIALFDVFVYVVRLPYASELPPWFVAAPLEIAMVLPLVFRRRYPLVAAYLILVIGIPHAWLALGAASVLTSIIAVYTVVVYTTRRHAAYYVAALLATSVVQVYLQFTAPFLTIFVAVAITALAWVFGEFVGARRAHQQELEARLDLLETERDHAGRIAVAEERGRIARELHDVVAHSVSVIVVQADGATYALPDSPELARHAVDTISETGRATLAELRRLLDVLRNDEAGEPFVPQPGTGALTELTERMRQAGLRVRLELGADLADLPAGVSLGVYRIVQEALTNILKHAGEGATATVTAHCRDGSVRVDVLDDGAGRANPPSADEAAPAKIGGNGVIGMRERAHVYGGTLEAGPEPGGGWRVYATLPTEVS